MMSTRDYDQIAVHEYHRNQYNRLPDPSWYVKGKPKPRRDALDPDSLVNKVGTRVILIEQVGDKYYGTIEGEVVWTDNDESFVLHIRCSEGSVHRFVDLQDFDGSQDQFFIHSTWLRRIRYATEEASRWKAQTVEVFAKAAAKGVLPLEDIPRCRELGAAALDRYLCARLNITFPSNGEVLRTLNNL